MIGIDTNIVLRYLLKDDPALSPRALEIIAGNDCFVSRAALTEVVYTLESYYRSSRADIGRALDALLSIQRVTVEDRAVTERVVSWYKAGMDFGDAMIAASSHRAARVETFDRDFARLARKLRTAPPVEFAVK
ncbi:MAG: type II toxin-antitoxin system VapC family toxin [Betaproteobacteria bacterium]|nr:type II toxin-antitoxin system VapC family toxin [Betaproteobacteria bacterium]